MTGTAAIVVAAGAGSRMGGDAGGKVFRSLGGAPVIRRAIAPLAAHEAIGVILPIIREGDQGRLREALAGVEKAGIEKILPPVIGGETRSASVRAGLESLAASENPPARILIHDAARPLCPPDLIGKLLAALDEYDGVAPSLPATDSLKKNIENQTLETISRSNVFSVQTPQAFRFEALLDAHRKAGADFPDDLALAASVGCKLTLIPGARENIKLTHEEDFALARLLLGQETRIGHGFDVHQFTTGDHVMLGGVRVPHDRSLAGHSDADPLLHALTDAILGAAGCGDIGQHFPSSDPRWKGAASSGFVTHAVEKLRAGGGRIVQADLTMVAAAPKLSPHRDFIRYHIAVLLGIGEGRVNLKATTTDGIGSIGRGEGIAAHAVVSSSWPAYGGPAQ